MAQPPPGRATPLARRLTGGRMLTVLNKPQPPNKHDGSQYLLISRYVVSNLVIQLCVNLH